MIQSSNMGGSTRLSRVSKMKKEKNNRGIKEELLILTTNLMICQWLTMKTKQIRSKYSIQKINKLNYPNLNQNIKKYSLYLHLSLLLSYFFYHLH